MGLILNVGLIHIYVNFVFLYAVYTKQISQSRRQDLKGNSKYHIQIAVQT
jgi:hypothetical protein